MVSAANSSIAVLGLIKWLRELLELLEIKQDPFVGKTKCMLIGKLTAAAQALQPANIMSLSSKASMQCLRFFGSVSHVSKSRLQGVVCDCSREQS